MSTDYKLPVTHFPQFMNLRPFWSYCLYTWGGLHRYFGNQNNVRREYERAVHYFNRAYEVNPKFTYARLQKAILLGRELHQYEQSLVEFDAYLAEEGDDPSGLMNKGLVLQEYGRFPEALACLEQYLNLPEKDEHQIEIARIADYLREIIAETNIANDE